MSKFIGLFGIIAVLFVSCAPAITEGTVYTKEFSPAHTEMRSTTAQTFTSKGVLISIVNVPVSCSDSWYISYRVLDEKNHKYRTNMMQVSEEVYNSTDIGSWFTTENR